MKIENSTQNITDKIMSGINFEEQNGLKAKDNHQNLLRGESPAVISGANILEKNGYKVDAESINALRKILTGDSDEINAKLEALDISLKKDMPIKEELLSRLKNFSKASMLDFLNTSTKTNTKLGETRKRHSEALEHKKSLIEKTNNTLEKLFNAIDFKEKNSFKVNTELHDQYEEKNKKSFSSDISDKKNPKYNENKDSNFEDLKNYKINNNFLENMMSDYEDENLFKNDIIRIAEYLQASQNINENFTVSMVLETKITPRLASLKTDFDNLKKDLNIDLFKISSENSSLNKQDKIELLSKNIDKLDSAIMKSEMSLYISLKGERELIKLSSELQFARESLNKGDYNKAEKIVKDSLSVLKNIEYKPSIKKAYAVMNSTNSFKNAEAPNIKDLTKWITEGSTRFALGEKSVSSLTNYIRNLGLNTEVEEFDNLFRENKESVIKDFKNISNLKTILSKIIGNTGNNSDSKTAEKISEHLEGMQLRNKIIDSKEPQTMAIELPINLNGTIKSVKVFINSPQKMLKLDWENFDMFFALHTEKLGDIGIRVKAVQRNLKVNILNDRVNSMEKESKFAEEFKKDVEQFGFNLINMVLKAWDKKIKEKFSNKTDGDHLIKRDPYSKNNGKFDIKI